MPTGAYNQDIPTTQTRVFNNKDDGGSCSTFWVGCSSGVVIVHIPGLTKTSEGIPVRAGSERLFRIGTNGIQAVYLTGEGGTATVDYGVVGRIAQP